MKSFRRTEAATHPKNATAAIYWYHDQLAKLCEKIPRTYRTRHLNNDDPAFVGTAFPFGCSSLKAISNRDADELSRAVAVPAWWGRE
jgi:hypothetical protein